MSVNTDLIGSVFDLPPHIDPRTIPAWHDWDLTLASTNTNNSPNTSTRQDRQRASTIEDNWARIPNILAADLGGPSTQELKQETTAEWDEITADLAEEVKGGCYGEDFEYGTSDGDSQIDLSGSSGESVAGTVGESVGSQLDWSKSSAESVAGTVGDSVINSFSELALDSSGSSRESVAGPVGVSYNDSFLELALYWPRSSDESVAGAVGDSVDDSVGESSYERVSGSVIESVGESMAGSWVMASEGSSDSVDGTLGNWEWPVELGPRRVWWSTASV